MWPRRALVKDTRKIRRGRGSAAFCPVQRCRRGQRQWREPRGWGPQPGRVLSSYEEIAVAQSTCGRFQARGGGAESGQDLRGPAQSSDLGFPRLTAPGT